MGVEGLVGGGDGEDGVTRGEGGLRGSKTVLLWRMRRRMVGDGLRKEGGGDHGGLGSFGGEYARRELDSLSRARSVGEVSRGRVAIDAGGLI